MLTARPTPIARAAIVAYFARKARSRFSTIAARHLERLSGWSRGEGEQGPLLLLANHTSWWDAVLPILISRAALRHDAYAMMDRRQLSRYPFFRRVGVFSIDRENARSAMRSLDYAAGLIAGTPRTLWMFPQGVIAHNDRRPLGCETGAAHLAARLGACTLAPVAFRYEVGREELPIALASVGPLRRIEPGERVTPRELGAEIEEMLTQEVDHLRESVVADRLEDFHPFLVGARSVSQRWDRVRRIGRGKG